MRRCVLLEHHLPTGATHYDWLIERESGDDPYAPSLLSFRLPTALQTEPPVARHAPDEVVEGIAVTPPAPALKFSAEELGDHRRRYLEYEGELTGARGEVRRLAMGSVLELRVRASAIDIRIDWGGMIVSYKGRRDRREPRERLWRFNESNESSR